MSPSEPSRPQRATLVPTEPQDPQVAALLLVVDKLSRVRAGPLLSGVMGGVLAVVGHHLLTDSETTRRLEIIERHLAWQQAAIVAQSRGEPLPPPPLTFEPKP